MSFMGLWSPESAQGTTLLEESSTPRASFLVLPPLPPALPWFDIYFFISYLDGVGSTGTSWQDRTKRRKGMSHYFL